MIELLCTDYNKKATSIHYYFGNAVLERKPRSQHLRGFRFVQWTIIAFLVIFILCHFKRNVKMLMIF